MQQAISVAAAAVMNDGVVGAIHKEHGNGTRWNAGERPRHGGSHSSNSCNAIGHVAPHVESGKAAFAQTRGVDAARIHGIMSCQLIEHAVEELNVRPASGAFATLSRSTTRPLRRIARSPDSGAAVRATAVILRLARPNIPASIHRVGIHGD